MYKTKKHHHNKYGDVLFMEKIGRLSLLIICCLLIVSCCKVPSPNYEDIMRIRIIANSNNDCDQKEKELVKDALYNFFIVNYHINEEMIKEALNKELNQDLFNKLEITMTTSNYEAKAYQGSFIPSGTYDTLLIVIGEGKGHNFWTLLYPEFFNVSFEDKNEIEYRSYLWDKINK